MDEQNMAETEELDVSNGGAEQPEATEAGQPRSLADAFRMVAGNDTAAAESDVQEPSGDGPAASDGEEHTDVGGSATVSESIPPQPAASPQSSGQQSDAITLDDLAAALKDQATREVANAYRQAGVRTMTLDDLYERDEDTGRVLFHDPDNEGRFFESRVQAQEYVDAYNRGWGQKAQAMVRDRYQELQEHNKDVIDLVAFNPVYESMSDDVKEVFESLIAPYETQNSDGYTVFPGVDFYKTAQQAVAQVQIMNRKLQQYRGTTAQQPQEQKPQQRGPALDLKSGSSSNSERPAPRNLGEALRYVNEDNAKARKNKKGGKR